MPLPLDVHQMGTLARRDLERACRDFLTACGDRCVEVLQTLKADPPPEWSLDLLQIVDWLVGTVRLEGRGWQPEQLVARLFQPDQIVASPLTLVRKSLAPGDEVSGDIVQRLGSSLSILEGEGERLIALEPVLLLMGSHLGYMHASPLPVRARRVTVAEQEAIHRCYQLLMGLLEQSGPTDSQYRLLELRFDGLLTAPNQNMPATLKRLTALSARQRSQLWREVVEHVRAQALPVDRRPALARLIDRVGQLKVGVDSTHVTRLLRLASQLYTGLERDAAVEQQTLQAGLGDLRTYLEGESGPSLLARYASEAGIVLVNLALLQLSSGEGCEDWPAELEPELIAFRDRYLKHIYSRASEWLLAIEPAELIRRELERNERCIIPRFGDPDRLLESWTRLETEIRDRIAGLRFRWAPPGWRSASSATAESDEDDEIEFSTIEGFVAFQEEKRKSNPDALEAAGTVRLGRREEIATPAQRKSEAPSAAAVSSPAREVSPAPAAVSLPPASAASSSDDDEDDLEQATVIIGPDEFMAARGAHQAEAEAAEVEPYPEDIADPTVSVAVGGAGTLERGRSREREPAPEAGNVWIRSDLETFPLPVFMTRAASGMDQDDDDDDSISSRIGTTGSFPLPMPEDDSVSLMLGTADEGWSPENDAAVSAPSGEESGTGDVVPAPVGRSSQIAPAMPADGSPPLTPAGPAAVSSPPTPAKPSAVSLESDRIVQELGRMLQQLENGDGLLMSSTLGTSSLSELEDWMTPREKDG